MAYPYTIEGDPIMSEPAASDSEFKDGWPVVLSAMLGIGLGLSPVPFYTIGVFAPQLAKAFGWGFAQIMAGVTVSTLVVICLSPLVGILSDRVGVRRVVMVSVALFGLSFMGFALSNGSLVLYYLTWGLVAAVGAGTLPITWTRAVNNRFDRHKGLALGLSLLGTGLFGYLVKPFTAWAVAGYGWRAAYVFIGALPLLIALPAAYFGFRDAGPARQNAAERRASEAAKRAVTPGLTVPQALTHWRFWLVGIAFLPIAFTVGGVIPNVENILKLGGFAPAQIVGLASLIGLSVIVGRTAGGWLFDRFWAPGVAVFLLGIPAGACWMLAHGPLGYELAAVAIVLVGFAAGVEYDLMAFLVARYFGMKSYGTIYGLLYSFFALGAGVGPVAFGATFDKTHSYVTILTLCAGLMVLGSLMLLFLGRYRDFGQVPRGAAVIAEAERTADATAI
jgi:MFS family permease